MSYQAFIGKSERRQDTVWPLSARALAATLNVAAPDGEHLPPLWHWTIFQEWAPARTLGADGHPQRDGFLPVSYTHLDVYKRQVPHLLATSAGRWP